MKTQKSYFPFLFHFSRQFLLISLAACISIVTGCVSPSVTNVDESSLIAIDETSSQEIPVTRYGRYTLVEVGATAAQQDLLLQVIDVTIPAPSDKKSPTVADAMQYVLLNSGYQLCDSAQISAFNYFYLPLAHYHLGPITVQDALSVLAGTGWHLQADHQKRLICFTLDKDQQNNEFIVQQEVQP